MIYFDNAATSFPKPKCVIDEVNICIKEYCGNPGRSSHRLSVKSSEAIYEAREAVARLLNFPLPENVVFTYNATYALNMAIKSFINEPCHVLTSDIEHNAVIRPLEALKENIGIEHSEFSTDGNIEKDILNEIRPDTKAIVSTLVSNVTGKEIPLDVLSKVAKMHGLILIVDASQAIGHGEIDLTKTPCDALCAPAHKALFGIQGCGFVLFKNSERRKTLVEGGSGTNSKELYMPRLLPEGYEAGTLATPAIAALRSGINFVMSEGVENIKNRTYYLAERLREGIRTIKSVDLYKTDGCIVSFNVKGMSSQICASKLDKYGVCTRAGFHCAPSAHKKLGTFESGCVRASLSYFNTEKEVYDFLKIIRSI